MLVVSNKRIKTKKWGFELSVLTLDLSQTAPGSLVCLKKLDGGLVEADDDDWDYRMWVICDLWLCESHRPNLQKIACINDPDLKVDGAGRILTFLGIA